MKKMKLFPKTFLYTFFMLLFITTSMHLMIYFFYPKVYLSRMQDQLEKKMDTLQQEIKRNTAAEAGQIFSDFAKQNNVNVTVECAGSEVTYMGMDFQISLYTDADMVFDVSNLENAESIIVKNKTMEADDGIEIQVEVMASAMPVKEAFAPLLKLRHWLNPVRLVPGWQSASAPALLRGIALVELAVLVVIVISRGA